MESIKEEDATEMLNDAKDMTNILRELKQRTKYLLKQSQLSNANLQEIQDYLLCVLYSNIIPIRKSMDYIHFRIKGVDKDNDNYIENNKFIFNKHKTSKTYHKQIILLPMLVKRLIEKWMKINPTQFLLIDSQNNKLNSVKMTQRLNKLFGDKISVNALSKKYKA